MVISGPPACFQFCKRFGGFPHDSTIRINPSKNGWLSRFEPDKSRGNKTFDTDIKKSFQGNVRKGRRTFWSNLPGQWRIDSKLEVRGMDSQIGFVERYTLPETNKHVNISWKKCKTIEMLRQFPVPKKTTTKKQQQDFHASVSKNSGTPKWMGL